MKVYTAEYTSCHHESDFGILDIYLNKIDAFKRILREKRNTYINWFDDRLIFGKDNVKDKPFSSFEIYRIKEYEIK